MTKKEARQQIKDKIKQLNFRACVTTSAVKSPLVRRKVRPWAMAASIWESRARVANDTNDTRGLTAIKTKMAEEIPVHKNTNGFTHIPPTHICRGNTKSSIAA